MSIKLFTCLQPASADAVLVSVCVFIRDRNRGDTVEYSSGHNVLGCSGSFDGCPSVRLFVHLSICLSICPSVWTDICLGFQTSLKTLMGDDTKTHAEYH